jgi:hypothetical protein
MKPIIKISGEVITIKELKDFVKDLPEKDSYTGDDYEVWIGRGNISNPCRQLWTLNKSDRGCDILLSDDVG